jgi:hypothetical protein
MPTTAKTKSNGHAPKEQTQVRILLNNASEQGTSGLKQWGGFIQAAYNAALYWPTVQPLYSRLRTSMPEIVMVRRAFSSWARNMQPVVDLPENPTDDDKRYQDFIYSDFENMEGGSARLLDTIVNHVPFYGWGWWEAVPARRDPEWIPPSFVDQRGEAWPDDWRSEQEDGLIGMRRLAWRDTSTFYGWEFDGTKRMIAMKQQDFPNRAVTLRKKDSLHLTFGDPNNPEGSTPLEAVWRLERIKYGLEVIQGIGFEHAAGHAKFKKTEAGTLSTEDKQNVATAARNLLSAQEGNYMFLPFGVDADVIDVAFQAAGSLLEAIKHYSILALSVYMMQTIILNTLTDTGARAASVDSTQLAIFSFNSMMDGFASQYDDQIGRRLWEWNRHAFPNATRRPNIRFSHVQNNIDLGSLGTFLGQINGIIPLSLDDYKAFRRQSGFMPENNPEPGDVEEARTLDDAGDAKPEESIPPTPEEQLFKQKVKVLKPSNDFAFPNVSNKAFSMMSLREANWLIREYGGGR